MFTKMSEDFSDMLYVRGLVLGEDENVIQVDDSKSVKMVLTNRWNTAGVFIRPNGMTSHS